MEFLCHVLLFQLQDWNNRRQFTSAADFYAQEAVDDTFISQVTNLTFFSIDICKPFIFLFYFLNGYINIYCLISYSFRQWLKILEHMKY